MDNEKKIVKRKKATKKIVKRKKAIAMAWTLLGIFGAHWFYLGQPAIGILYISISACTSLLACLPTIIFSMINFFQLMLMTDREFDAKYQRSVHGG